MRIQELEYCSIGPLRSSIPFSIPYKCGYRSWKVVPLAPWDVIPLFVAPTDADTGAGKLVHWPPARTQQWYRHTPYSNPNRLSPKQTGTSLHLLSSTMPSNNLLVYTLLSSTVPCYRTPLLVYSCSPQQTGTCLHLLCSTMPCTHILVYNCSL
jgi:hypothetical protein